MNDIRIPFVPININITAKVSIKIAFSASHIKLHWNTSCGRFPQFRGLVQYRPKHPLWEQIIMKIRNMLQGISHQFNTQRNTTPCTIVTSGNKPYH